jgi:hypothetical protein
MVVCARPHGRTLPVWLQACGSRSRARPWASRRAWRARPRARRRTYALCDARARPRLFAHAARAGSFVSSCPSSSRMILSSAIAVRTGQCTGVVCVTRARLRSDAAAGAATDADQGGRAAHTAAALSSHGRQWAVYVRAPPCRSRPTDRPQRSRRRAGCSTRAPPRSATFALVCKVCRGAASRTRRAERRSVRDAELSPKAEIAGMPQLSASE